MATFVVGKNEYSTRKMNALRQMHLMVKVAPLFMALALEAKAEPAPASGEAGFLTRAMGNLEPLLKAVSALPPADLDAIVATCLSHVSRSSGKGAGWSPVWNEAAGVPQFDDIELPEMLQLVGRVIQESLGNFTAALPS